MQGDGFIFAGTGGVSGHNSPAQVGLWFVTSERVGCMRPLAEFRIKRVRYWRKIWLISEGLNVVVPLKEAKLSPGLAMRRLRLR